MTGWNLPPGVSGFEPQIAGYDEAVLYVTCTNPDCGYEGDTDVEIDGMIFWWTCPECDTEQENDNYFEGWGE